MATRPTKVATMPREVAAVPKLELRSPDSGQLPVVAQNSGQLAGFLDTLAQRMEVAVQQAVKREVARQLNSRSPSMGSTSAEHMSEAARVE